MLLGACGQDADAGGAGGAPAASDGGSAGISALPLGGTGGGGQGTGGVTASGGGAPLGGTLPSGGAETGGSGTGGGPTGGLATGGAASGGASAGGQAWGGSAALGGGLAGGAPADGGTATGGDGTGGTATGGVETGGTATGGVETGGTTTGGVETGGTATGGVETGGTATGGAGGSGGGELSPVTVYLAGDSTVATYTDTASPTDQAGWGQMLPEILDDRVTVVNRAAGGRTALWFHLEGAAAWILERLEPGDYFFVQFGTNDGNKTATFVVDGVTYPRYAEASTDFKVHLKDFYLDPTRAVGATPVLVTPPPRNSAYCGAGNSLGSYAQAMRELGAAEGVAVLDLNDATFSYLSAICPAPTPEDFFFLRADGTVDGTHFQEHGARMMAGFLGDAMVETDLGLAAYLLP